MASSGELRASSPLVHNALRICLSTKEYALLHEFAIKRTPSIVKDNFPFPATFDSAVHPRNKHNEAAVRASLRVFLVSGGALRLVDLILNRLREDASRKTPRAPLRNSPNFRLSLSLSLVLLFHRLLYRFLVRLRANLRTDNAQPFRMRNPRISKALTSRYAPAIGASLAGLALGICPQNQLRMTITIYATTRSLEFLYNVFEENGWFEKRPWWFGSWLLMPVSCAQLFHAVVFDRETSSKWLPSVILWLSPSYIRDRPVTLRADHHWPDKYEIIDSLAEIANLRWPPFISPILHPSNPNTLPAAVQSISPITGPAHPSISSLSCALLHPKVPNCSTAFLHHILLSVPPLARLLTIITLALSVFKFKLILANPVSSASLLSQRIIKFTAVFAAAAGSLWGSLCLFHAILPRTVLPTKRFFISGALGGLPFAFLSSSRTTYLAFFRAAIDSAWKAGAKSGLWNGRKGGELWLIVLSWAVMGAVLEARPTAVQGKGFRKGLTWLRGDGFIDPVNIQAKRRAKKGASHAKKIDKDQ